MKKVLSPVRFLSIGYIFTIMVGTILLLFPDAAKNGYTSFLDALFTATSATCVTGLIPFDTYTHWTMFGQIVIIVLIQIGGLGFMTIITLFFMLIGKKLSLYNRTIMMQSAGSYNISGIGKLIRRIVIGTIIFEGLGAVIITSILSKEMSFSDALFKGIFHSISAFCNAGFDIFGTGSLTAYKSNSPLLITIMVLIIVGGSGFIIWSDLIDNKFNLKKLEVHSKVVLVFNAILIVVPALLFLMFEFTNIGNGGAFTDFSFKDKLVNAFFLSVSPRTAGFNAVDMAKLTSSGKLLTNVLMFIGGNSGSTAGGLKVTTFVVVAANLYSQMRGHNKVVLFKRQIPDKIVKQSSALFVAYVALIIGSGILIAAFDEFSFEQIMFEVTSAVGTVGLTSGVSAAGNTFTKLILTFLMFAGRIGGLSLLSLFITKENNEYILEEPKGKIIVG